MKILSYLDKEPEFKYSKDLVMLFNGIDIEMKKLSELRRTLALEPF